jgi:zinc protease
MNRATTACLLGMACCIPQREQVARPSEIRTPVSTNDKSNDWRSVMPAPGKASRLAAPSVSEFVLGNGLRVALVERHSLPLVTIRLIVPGGASSEPPDKIGITKLLAELIEQGGTGGKTGAEVATALEDLGASISATGGFESIAVSLDVDRRSMALALDVFANVILRPDLPGDEFLRVRQEAIADARPESQRGSQVAWFVLRTLLYEKSGHVGAEEGTAEAVRSLSIEDVRRIRSSWIPANAQLVIVGDVTKAELAPLLKKHFEPWAQAASKPTGISRENGPLPTFENRIVLVDKPGVSQVSMSIAVQGPTRLSPDWPVAKIINRAFGGGYASRLNLRLRQEKGYTYSVRSRLSARGNAGIIVISGDFATETAVDALREILGAMKKLSESPPSGEELARARNGTVADIAWYLQTTSGIAGLVEEATTHGLPANSLATYLNAVMTVDEKSVAAIAAKYFSNTAATVVMVGPVKELEKQLSAASMQYTIASMH